MTLKPHPLDEREDVTTYLRECLSVDEDDLDSEFVRVAADYAYWAARYTDAVRAFEHAKLDEERMEAVLWEEHKDRLSNMGQVNSRTGAPTEANIKAAVNVDDRLTAVRESRIDAEVEKTKLKLWVDAIGHKKDAIQSLGAKARVLMDRDPLVRERETAVRESRARQRNGE